MRVARVFIIILSLSLVPAMIHAAEEAKERQNLDVLADDLKFQNGAGFIKIRMFDKALETLKEYLEIFYNGNHRHEAYRLIAEIYFNRMEYPRAIENYRALYEEFSTSDSGVGAYFNIGLCYIKMGDEKKAAEIFNDIVDNHPESAFRQQAAMQLDVMSIIQE
jgi:TolA-binding protein